MMAATLSIPITGSFKNASEIPSRLGGADPRLASFRFDRVDIDLRTCEFIRPAAMLWCAVYLTLAVARGARCRLLVPENMGACAGLKAAQLFEVLKQRGIEVDDRGVPTSSSHKNVMPVTAFGTVEDAQRITNAAHQRLTAANLSAVNLNPIVSELFSELALNAAQHSESPVGAFGCIQFVPFRSGSQFVCVVADGGIGIRKSLSRNPKLKDRVSYDWDALDLAIRERVSGTGDPHRGIGLWAVAEEVRIPGRSLLLHSGQGLVEIREDLQRRARRSRLFPGTLVYLAIPA